MALSKKTYIDMAKRIKSAKDSAKSQDLPLEALRMYNLGVDTITEELCIMFAKDNPRFDRERFIDATR